MAERRSGEDRRRDERIQCGVLSPEGRRCTWPGGHKRALIPPGAARGATFARGGEVHHSWAMPSLFPRVLRDPVVWSDADPDA